MDRERFNALLAEHGESATLSRSTGAGTWSTPLPLKAKFFGATGNDLVGAQQQLLRRVKIGTAELVAAAAPAPKRLDRLADAGGKIWSVQTVEVRRDGDTIWAYFMTVLG